MALLSSEPSNYRSLRTQPPSNLCAIVPNGSSCREITRVTVCSLRGLFLTPSEIIGLADNGLKLR